MISINCKNILIGKAYGYHKQKIISVIYNLLSIIAKALLNTMNYWLGKILLAIEKFQKCRYHYDNKDNTMYRLNMIVRSLFT